MSEMADVNTSKGDMESNDAPSSPITFSSMGIPPTSTKPKDTVVGKVRPLGDLNWCERVLLVCMPLSIIAVIVFTIIRISNVDVKHMDFTFGLVVIINSVFCLIYLIEGIFRERPSEMFVLTLATGTIVVYLIVNYIAGVKTTIKLARLIVACALSPLLIGLSATLTYQYHVSRRLIFKIVGAQEVWQKRLSRLLVLQDALKMDLQLGISMVVLVLVSGAHVSNREIAVLCVGVPLSIFWFFLGYLAMQAESVPGVTVFAILSPAEPAYIVYKVVRVIQDFDEHSGVSSATIVCAFAALTVRVMLLVLAYLVWRGFGQGLKEQVKDMKLQNKESEK